jgi:hypothetical protein
MLLWVCIQTSVLRYVRMSYDLTSIMQPSGVRHTLLGTLRAQVVLLGRS